ncbi:C40 family peptidase [Nesterenkonia sp. NBAIMH1]|uniref:C40 family peptidase n=1 Tax=Nesterenkonia sp. NBAIMH1 TaxID=2600320 RepID=UPI0011B3697B|nr:C40 family peptidase [Nesterenkonia sp. NBAIMH1]
MTFSSAMGRIGQIESAIGAYSPQAPPPGAAQNVPRSGGAPALAASEARAVSAEPGTALRGPQPLSGPASDFEALMRVLSYAEELGAGPRSSAPRDASSSVPGASPASSASSATPAGSASSGDGSGRDIVAAAQKHHGVPYLWGGTDPSRGLDCSGLVKNVMAEFGISVPRVAAAQARVGKEVPSLEQAKPGDLIVTRGGGHIGIYAGSGEWTHAPRPGRSVVTEPVSGTIMTIRRMVDSPQEASAAPAAQTASADRGAFEARMAGART